MKLSKGKVELLKKRFPDKIPCLVLKNKSSKLQNIDKQKYLVPNDITFGQFFYIIRKRLLLDDSETLFLFVNNMLPPNGILMGQLFKEQKNNNGYLEIIYMEESVFG
jgi:GABA(A) receptor-associated protein